MTYLGVDSCASINASAAKILRENGISFVGRYLVPAGMGKDLTATEIVGLREAGLAILLCWEIEAAAVKQGAERGAKDGIRAKALALQFGVPSGTAIYFACDYGPAEAEYPIIEQYIKAAQATCYPYEAGLYGPAGIVDYLGKRGACKKFWQCVGWSGGRVSEYMSAYQYQWSGGPDAKALAKKVGFDVDLDRADSLEAAGLWMPPTVRPWYADAMAWAKSQGIIKDGRPNDPVTRAELATVLYRIYVPEDDKKDSGMLS